MLTGRRFFPFQQSGRKGRLVGPGFAGDRWIHESRRKYNCRRQRKHEHNTPYISRFVGPLGFASGTLPGCPTLPVCKPDHSKPKPSALRMASLRSCSSFSFDEYSGRTNVLKHVWLVGSFPLSVPSRWMTVRMLPRPPMGARSLPVKNLRNCCFSCAENSRMTCEVTDQLTWGAQFHGMSGPRGLAHLPQPLHHLRLGIVAVVVLGVLPQGVKIEAVFSAYLPRAAHASGGRQTNSPRGEPLQPRGLEQNDARLPVLRGNIPPPRDPLRDRLRTPPDPMHLRPWQAAGRKQGRGFRTRVSSSWAWKRLRAGPPQTIRKPREKASNCGLTLSF